MAAYVIVDIDVRDPDRYERYKQLAPASIARYGGRYLARGGATEVFEGEWVPKRLVLLEFDSLERARRWHDSPESADALALRRATTISNMVAVDGV